MDLQTILSDLAIKDAILIGIAGFIAIIMPRISNYLSGRIGNRTKLESIEAENEALKIAREQYDIDSHRHKLDIIHEQQKHLNEVVQLQTREIESLRQQNDELERQNLAQSRKILQLENRILHLENELTQYGKLKTKHNLMKAYIRKNRKLQQAEDENL